jgi:hypothetical protein
LAAQLPLAAIVLPISCGDSASMKPPCSSDTTRIISYTRYMKRCSGELKTTSGCVTPATACNLRSSSMRAGETRMCTVISCSGS